MCNFFRYLQTVIDKFLDLFFTRKKNNTNMNQPLVEIKNEKTNTRLFEYHVIYPDKQIYI
jgi:hypothetical protein